jgi:multicomponent Na+:H+ antiporter subunit D
MRAAMLFLAFLCIAIGINPAPLYAMLPYPVDFIPYTGSHVVSQLQLLLFSGLAFFVLLGWLKRTETITLDVDWLWRKPGRALALDLGQQSTRAWFGFTDRTMRAMSRFLQTIYRHHGPGGLLARTWPTGSMAFWTTFLLAAYLIFYYF